MWFISPPVAEHKEWGVLLTLGMAQSQPSHAQVGMRNTLCPWEMSRQELLKPWLSSAEFPVHTLKFCTLLKVSPEKPVLHICSCWGVLELSRWMGKVKKPSGTFQAEERLLSLSSRRARGAQQWHRQGLGTSRAVPCWGWGTISAQQMYLNRVIEQRGQK